MPFFADAGVPKPLLVEENPPYEIIPLDGTTHTLASEPDQNATTASSSAGDILSSEDSDSPLGSPYGNLNMSYVSDEVATFASKLPNPGMVRQFYHEYSLLDNFPRGREIRTT